MQEPRKPDNEEQRIASLKRLKILDTSAEDRFDRITRVASTLFNVPIALVSLVDANRQWFKACYGLDASETPRGISFCGHAILEPDAFVIEDATKDDRFKDNPLVTGDPHVIFYAGMPLTIVDGTHPGTLCLIDNKPRTFSEADRSLLRDMAKWVEIELNIHDTNAALVELDQERALLATAKKRLELATHSGGIGIWEWDIVKNVLAWDDQMYKLYGISSSDFGGAYDAWQSGLHPDDKKPGDEAIQLALKGAKEFDTTFRVIWPTGEVRFIRAHARVERDGSGTPLHMIGVNWDITDEKNSEANLKQFEAVIRDTEEAVISKDLTGKVQSWNGGAERLYGYTALEMIGESIRRIIPPENDDLDALLSRVKNGERIPSYMTTRRKKDGSLVDVALTISPLRDDTNTIIGASVLARDITKERQIDKAKTEFVSLASHQLRTPLSAINWFAQMLEAGDAGALNEEQKVFVKQIIDSNKRMVDLVDSLLNVSRIDLGTFAIDPEIVVFPLIANSILAELESQIQNKKQSVEKVYDAQLSGIMADPKLVGIIFQNLISNAVKYTGDGGKITVRIEKKDPFVQIAIADTGYGIPKAQQGRIFEKLFRADNVREMETDGTGLGLYIIKAIAEEVGGKAWFESEEGKGTTFYVTIPLSGMKKKDGNKELD